MEKKVSSLNPFYDSKKGIGSRFQEKDAYAYIYVDAANKVHVLVPLSAGQELATDNTCETFREINPFFKGKTREEAGGGIRAVRSYIADLNRDIDQLNNEIATNSADETLLQANIKLATSKQERLNQLRQYEQILTTLPSAEILAAFPAPINQALAAEEANCAGMLLNPGETVKSNAIKLTQHRFSLKRERGNNSGHIVDHTSLSAVLNLAKEQKKFIKSAQYCALEKKLLATITEEYQKKYPSEGKAVVKNEEQLTFLKNCIKNAFKTHCDYSGAMDFLGYFVGEADAREIDFDYISGCLCNVSPSVTKVFGALRDMAVSSSSIVTVLRTYSSGNPFEEVEGDKLTIAIQFFLAVAALDYYAHTGDTINFGANLERDQETVERFVNAVQTAYQEGRSVEDCILDQCKNLHLANNGLMAGLATLGLFEFNYFDSARTRKRIIQRFKEQWNILNPVITRESAIHFDEFLQLLPDKKGHFYGHNSRISLHLGRYLYHDNTRQDYQTYFNDSESGLTTTICTQKGEHSVLLSPTNSASILAHLNGTAIFEETPSRISRIKNFFKHFFNPSLWGVSLLVSIAIGLFLQSIASYGLALMPAFDIMAAIAVTALPVFAAMCLISLVIYVGRCIIHGVEKGMPKQADDANSVAKGVLTTSLIISLGLSIFACVSVWQGLSDSTMFVQPVIEFFENFLSTGIQGIGIDWLTNLLVLDSQVALIVAGSVCVAIPVVFTMILLERYLSILWLDKDSVDPEDPEQTVADGNNFPAVPESGENPNTTENSAYSTVFAFLPKWFPGRNAVPTSEINFNL